MTITPIQLVPAQYLTNASAQYYVSTNIKTRIDKATFTNTDNAGAHTVDVHLVPNGQSVSASNLVIVGRSISAKVTYHAPELVGHVLGPGDSIYAVADAGSQVVFAAAGVTISP